MSSLKIWFEEKKGWIFFWLFLILVITLSFGTGYLMAREDNPTPIIIEKNSP